MSTRLPIPGSDDGRWGAILNGFLGVEHNGDGTLKKAADITQAKSNAATALSTAQSAQGDASSAVTTANSAQSTATAKYTKPVGGIPSSDLASAVQTNLTSASTAVQSVNTITGTSITLTAGDVGADASGAADAAQSGAENYTDAQITTTVATVVYDSGSSSYPTRATATSNANRVVMWIGPTAPAIGSGFAEPIDIWMKTPA